MRNGDIPLKNFFESVLDPEDEEPSRAFGLVLAELASEVPAFRGQAASRAVELLEKALQSWPEDLPAWEAKAGALWLLDRKTDALATIDFALTKAPRRESALRMAAIFASELGRNDDALLYWNRLLAVNPWRPSDHLHLAENLFHSKQPQRAIAECQAALRIEPANVKTRLLLVKCYLQSRQTDRARAEFETVLTLKPPNEVELRRWFAQQLP
jgi:tetratricopeptide (TPR) repeat protein